MLQCPVLGPWARREIQVHLPLLRRRVPNMPDQPLCRGESLDDNDDNDPDRDKHNHARRSWDGHAMAYSSDSLCRVHVLPLCLSVLILCSWPCRFGWVSFHSYWLKLLRKAARKKQILMQIRWGWLIISEFTGWLEFENLVSPLTFLSLMNQECWILTTYRPRRSNHTAVLIFRRSSTTLTAIQVWKPYDQCMVYLPTFRWFVW